MEAINLLANSSISIGLALPSILTSSPLPNSKLNMLAGNRFNLNLTLTRCSTQPNTNTNNELTPHSTTDSNSNLSAPNQQLYSSSSSSSSPISSSPIGLVFGLGTAGSWDSGEIGSPVIKRFLSDEEERWYMWYHGASTENPASDAIGLAVSSNGLHWERGKQDVKSSGDVGLVMNCGKDWWAFDTESIRPAEVVIMSSGKVRASAAVYWLYYTGFFSSSDQVEILDDDSLGFSLQKKSKNGNIFGSLPGLAISQDGRHWARIEGEHHSGALFDLGSEGDWDSLFIGSPQVVFHGNGDLRMYYHSFDREKGEFGIGMARSRDGIKWIKLGKIIGGGKTGGFDEFGVMNPRVLKNKKDGMYVMAYEGVDAKGETCIGLAVSPDGLKTWTRVQDEAVLRPAAGDGWDNKGIGSPCLVQMDGDSDTWRLYYRGVSDEETCGIGLAVSHGSDFTRFQRWTGFHA